MSMPFADIQDVVADVGPLWEDLRNATILITGGTGFIGSWLVESFVAANRRYGLNAKMYILSRDHWTYAQHELVSLNGDVQESILSMGFTHVVHAACTASPLIPPLEQFDTIIEGTRNVLNAAKTCKRMLYISSGAAKLRPETLYGSAKLAAEALCKVYVLDGLHVSIARPYALVGPGLPLDTHFAIGNFIRDALSGGPVVVQGGGESLRSYLYASDLAAWLWTILLRGEAGKPVDVGSTDFLSIEELAYLVAEVLGNVGVDIRRTIKELPNAYFPFKTDRPPKIGLREAILRTARFYQK